MPRELIPVRLRDGGPVVLAEVDAANAAWEGEEGFARASDAAEHLGQAAESIEGALDAVVAPTAEVVMDRLRKLSPDRVQLEFGLMLSGKAGLVFASAEAEAHFTVTLSWDRQEDGKS